MNYPKESAPLKDKMLDLAFKNKLLGEYELIYRTLKVQPGSIPKNQAYTSLKD